MPLPPTPATKSMAPSRAVAEERKSEPVRSPSAKPRELRRRADALLRVRQKDQKPTAETANSVADSMRLLHELQVHQIELELQNAELQEARDHTEKLLEKYTDLYDFAPVGYLIVERDGSIREANLTGASLLGLPRSVLARHRLSRFVVPEDRGTFDVFFQRVFAGPTQEECEVQVAVGGKPPVDLRMRAIRFEGEPACRMALTDLTAYKIAENRMRVSEVRYRRIFEAAHDGVILLDPETRKITDANPFMTKLLGYPRDRLVGKELYQIGLLRDEAASQEMFRKLKWKHEVRYEDLPLESQDGRHQEVEVVANLYHEGSRPVIQCNIRDITARKQHEELLRRNEALFSALIEQAPLGVYVVDAQFRLQQVNFKARPVFAKINPLIGRDFSEVHHLLWPKRISDQIVRRFRHTLKTGKPYREDDLTARRRDLGAVESYEWQIQRVTLPGGEHGVVAFFNDITERKKAEEARRRFAVLSAENQEARREISRRRKVEAALRKSEGIQRGLLATSQEFQVQLRHLTRQILTAQEEERKHISRELHDGVVQSLVGINVALSALGQGTPAGVRRKIAGTQRVVEKAVDTVHRFARDLRPAVLDDLGLIPALHAYCNNLAKQRNLKIRMTAFAGVEALGTVGRAVLFRVAQEALTNVARHAHASQVTVGITRVKNAVRLEIGDNGKSFQVGKVVGAANPKRLGLLGMKERVEMVGGSLAIKSAPGQGTTVRADIPFSLNKE